MKVEKEEESRLFDSPLVVGIVAHIPADRIGTLEKAVKSVTDADVVYRKVSENKLYLEEEGEADERRSR